MPNENCLKGMRCSKCGSEGPFKINVSAMAVIHDDGVAEYTEPDWPDHTFCACNQCGHRSTAGHFTEGFVAEDCRLWIGLHHHRHGVSVHPLFRGEEPGHDDFAEILGDDFEPDREDEYVEIVGSFELPEAAVAAKEALAVHTLRQIQEILWPGGDPDHQWSPDTLDEIVDVLRQASFVPATLE